MRSCAALRPSSAAWRVRVASLTFSSSCLRSWLSRRYPLTVRRLPPFRVGHARLLGHEPSNPFAVRRLESEELGEVPRRPEGERTSGGFAGDQPEFLQAFRVLVHLRADHVEQIALEDRLVVRDQGDRLQDVPIDLRGREGPSPLRVSFSDLHRPLRADLRDLERALPFRVVAGEGPQVTLGRLGLEARGPRQFVDRQGAARAVQRGFDEDSLLQWTASGGTSGFGPRTGIASSSSIGSSAFIESRFT